MALPASGAISLSQVNTELGRSASAAISLNDAAVRALAGVPSGAIGLSNLRGKSAVSPPTISITITGNNQKAYSHTVTAYIDCTLGGSPTTSAERISGQAGHTLTRMSNTQYAVSLGYSYADYTVTATYRITATNSAGSAYRDATITLSA